MADKKISQLTAASTPLAGTEVLPIVQGGATVKVSVDNLTTGKPVSATAITATNNVKVTGAPNTYWGLDFASGTSSGTYVTIADTATYDLATGSGMVFIWDDGGNGVAQIACFYGNTAIVWQNAAFYTNAGGSAGNLNVYYDAGSGKYRLQNLTGGTKNLYIGSIRMRLSS